MIDFPNNNRLCVRAGAYSLVKSLCDSASYQLSNSLSRFSLHLGKDAEICDLKPDKVNAWLVALEATHSQRSIAGHRGNLLALWRWLAELGDCEAPRQIRKVRKPEPMPVAWTLDELRQLLAVAEQAPGEMPDGTPFAVYWPATIQVAYSTGLRRSDLWILRHEQIRQNGSIFLRQHKTGQTHQPQLSAKALCLIRQIKHDPPLAWQGSNVRQWYDRWARLVKAAGIRPGALQQIRRTGATHLAIDHPERVQRYLGHRSVTMQRHYVDLTIAAPQSELPPEL